jgi:hypothetical protein
VLSEQQFQNPGSSDGTTAHGAASVSIRERLIVAVFLLYSAVSFFLIQYDRMRTAGAGLDIWVHLKLSRSAILTDGDQYRIALPLLMRFLQIHAHIRPNQSLPLIEFLCYAFALTLLYLLFRYSPQVENAPYSHRLIHLGFFLTAAQFPILWIFPWERPETLPTTFYLAAVVLLIVRRSRMPFALVCLFVLLLTLAQALTRADVPVVVGVATLLAAAMAIPFPRPRSYIAILGLLCGAVGGAAQWYLHHIFPIAAPSQTTSKFQLFANLNLLHPPLHIPIFLTALLPLIVSLVLLRRFHLPLDPSDKLVLLVCLVYLPVWVTMGLVVEVRIFVPFLFLASPTIAKLWGAFLFNQENGTPPNRSASFR